MIAQWTGDVIGKMHTYGITAKQLAAEIGWNVKYLSQVLNCRVCPKGAEEKVKGALDRIIQRIVDDSAAPTE